MTRWTARRFTLALVAVMAVGIALRMGPLLQSPLPFNPDGIVHSRNAHSAARTGHFPLSIMAVDSLGFGSFLSVLELVTGKRSLYISQPAIAIVGTFPAVLAAMLARRIGLRVGWTKSRARFAGVFAAALTATEGIFLFRSMPVDEQTPGLFLAPLATVCLIYGLWTTDRRWILAAVPIFLFLPPLHNLESVITGIALATLVGLALLYRSARPGLVRITALVALGFWVYFFAFNIGLVRLTPVKLIQSGRLTAAPGLFVAWIILAVFGIALFTRSSTRAQRTLLLAPFVAMYGLVVMNVFVPVFPGLPETSITFLVPSLALVVLAGIACWGYPVLARNGETRWTLIALFAGPLALIAFAVSAALTPVYFSTAVRTQYFIHLPSLVLVAATVAYVFRAKLQHSRPARSLVVGVVLFSVVISIPIAFSGLSVLSYKSVTTPAEFSAATFAHKHVNGSWASGDHLVRITRYHTNDSSGTVAPVYSWVHNPSLPPPNCPVLTKHSWTTVGAQFYPRPPATISDRRLDRLGSIAHRIYHGGSQTSLQLYQLRAQRDGTTCAEE